MGHRRRRGGAARRGAWSARTMRVTLAAAAVGPGAARRGARTMKATADAVGPGPPEEGPGAPAP